MLKPHPSISCQVPRATTYQYRTDKMSVNGTARCWFEPCFSAITLSFRNLGELPHGLHNTISIICALRGGTNARTPDSARWLGNRVPGLTPPRVQEQCWRPRVGLVSAAGQLRIQTVVHRLQKTAGPPAFRGRAGPGASPTRPGLARIRGRARSGSGQAGICRPVARLARAYKIRQL